METVYSDPASGSRLPAPGHMANVGNIERLVTLAAGAALLGYAWRHRSRSWGLTSAGLIARGATGYCPAYAALGVDHSDTKHALSGAKGTHVREALTINASPEELYTFWRHYENLPTVMPYLASVEEVDFKLSRWTAKPLGGVPVTWISETINEVPFETIGWKTLPGEAIPHAGSVVFNRLPETGATEVRVHFQYSPPGGKAAAWFAEFLGQDPGKATREGLQALKRHFEAGTVSATPPTSTI